MDAVKQRMNGFNVEEGYKGRELFLKPSFRVKKEKK